MTDGDERIESTAARRWDADALRAGASVCLVLAVPFRLLAAIVGTDSGGLNALLYFAYLVLFLIGAGCAAWVQRVGTPISHAMVAALGSAILVEIAFIGVRVVRGTPIGWIASFMTVSFIVAGATFGGILGSRLRARGVLPSTER